MREESVSRRYAAALFNQARGKGTLKETSADLVAIAETLIATPGLASLVGHPIVTQSRKKEAINTVFSSTISATTLAFLNLLVDKRRTPLLGEIKAEFDGLLREHNNVVAATAISAVPLTKVQLTALEKALEKRTGKDIELTTSVDSALMGGVLVRIGDTVLDGTVRGKLDRLRDQLLTRK